jgi:hypothetical protein
MNGLLSALLISSLALTPIQGVENTSGEANTEQPCRYEIVTESEMSSHKNYDTYAENVNKTVENNAIKTLEEPIRNDGLKPREKKPFIKISVKVAEQKAKKADASADAVDGEWDKIISRLDTKFEHMYKLKSELDKMERESAKLWSEYYALKEIYDRALRSLSENWAEDNGVTFVPYAFRR